MLAEAAESNAGGWCRAPEGAFGLAGEHDLAAVGRRANAGGGMDRQPDVPVLGEGWAPAVDAGAKTALQLVRPGPSRHRLLDAHRSLDRRRGPFEDGEELVRSGIDLPTTGLDDRFPNEAPHIVQQAGVPVAEVPEERCGVLDVGQQERDEAGGEGRHVDRLGVPPLRSELPIDEPDRHDPELLGGVQQPPAGPVSRRVVLEGHPLEPGQSVAHVSHVVDRQPAPAARVDVGERAVREPGPFASGKLRHGTEISRFRPRPPK
jgi:hypothetical protein